MLSPGTIAFTVLLALLTSLGPLSTDMYLPSLPAITADFGVGAAAVQLTLSAFLFGFAAGQIIYGPVSDRRGRKPTLIAGLLVYTLASVACAYAPSIEVLIVARFLQAFGAAGPIVLARSVVRDVYSGDSAGRQLARIGSFMGLVPAVAPAIGGVMQIAFGWPSTFIATFGVGVMTIGVVALRLPETLAKPVTDPLSFLSILRVYRTLATHPGYRAFVAIVCVTFAGLFAFISASSFILQGVYGLGEIVFGLAFGACALAYVLGTLVGHPLVARRGFAWALGVGCWLQAAGGLLMLAGVAFGPGLAAEIVGPMMIYMVGVGIGLPQSMAGALLPFPERAGAASSLMGFTQTSFGAVTGIFVGHALGAGAWPLAVAVAGMGVASLTIYAATRSARVIGAVG